MPTDIFSQAQPTIDDVRAAAQRIKGIAARTPLLEYPEINRLLGGRLLIKPEILQVSGAFKFRGAYNRLSLIPVNRRKSGVVAWSSGNHAQGVAAAARLLDMPAVIVMPADAPKIKVANTRAFGAEVVMYDRATESREDIGQRLAKDRGATIVPPYDDPDIIAGQGTVGLETAEQAMVAGALPDVLLVPCSGGGLLAGCALALAAESPDTQVLPVEPEGFDDTACSLAVGQRIRNTSGKDTICDALMLPTPGMLTFDINRRLAGPGLVVSDSEVCEAMRFAFGNLKLVVEPGGAVALAAVLSGKYDIRGRSAVVILSGGNVDPELFCQCLSGVSPKAPARADT